MTVDALAFGPHPDDVELACGGTLVKLARRGYRTAIVDLTRGEMGTRGSPERRAEEAAEAARILGVAERRCLDLGDGRLAVTPDAKKAVVAILRELRPRIVFTNYWENNHPDHAASGALVAEAAYLAGLARFEAAGAPHRPNRVLYYFLPHRLAPSFVVDVSEEFERKMEAVRAYRSQLYGGEAEAPATTIGQPDFLERIEAFHRYFGSLIEARYGEPFFLREALEIDDPVAAFVRPFTRFA